MLPVKQTLLACILMVTLLVVNVHGKMLRKENSLEEERVDISQPLEDVEDKQGFSEGVERGIFDFVFGNRPNNNLPAPAVIPQAPALSSSLPLPNLNRNQTLLQALLNRPLGSLLGVGGDRHDGFSMNWVRDALQKCSKVPATMLTAIFPTSTNGLQAPKIYYFENSTSNSLSWWGAQAWCTERNMQLVTVNDANENKVLQEQIKQILSSSPVGAAGNTFWIGLNDIEKNDAIWTWIGDPTSKFLDWQTTTANPDGEGFCVVYSQLASAENIHFDDKVCDDPATFKSRFICEVSDDCTSLFMARYPTKQHYHLGLLPVNV